MGKQPVIAWLLIMALVVPPHFVSASAAARPGRGDGRVICGERLINGGFEQGSLGWSQSSAAGHDLISDFYPRSGAWAAYLAGTNNADDRLSQTITLPANAISSILTAWWAIATEEPEVGFDRLTASVLNADGELLADLWTADSSAMVNVWAPIEADLLAYRGRTVILRLRAITDASNPTDFYVDDVSLLVCAPMQVVYLPMMTLAR